MITQLEITFINFDTATFRRIQLPIGVPESFGVEINPRSIAGNVRKPFFSNSLNILNDFLNMLTHSCDSVRSSNSEAIHIVKKA